MTQLTKNKYDLEERTAVFGEKIIDLCKKEAKETKYWLRMLAKAEASLAEECRSLWQEAQELNMIFSKIASNTKV